MTDHRVWCASRERAENPCDCDITPHKEWCAELNNPELSCNCNRNNVRTENPGVNERDRVRAVLAKLSDAELIESARKVAGAGGPLNVLITALLDRFARHIQRSASEIERLVRELEGLQRFKRGVDEALNQGDGNL